MKSHSLKNKVEGQLETMRCVFLDAHAECTVNPSLRDLREIVHRVKREGASFLTLTLPTFSEDFERSLAEGRISSTAFPSFRKSRSKGLTEAIPAFLQGMLSLLFDRTTGELYEHPPHTRQHIISVVRGVRQICRTFAKLSDRCTPKREDEAIEGFISNEQLLSDSKVHSDDVRDFYRVCRLLWDPIFSDFDITKLDPTHGPGASADRISGNSKFAWQTWHERLENYFPFLGVALPLGASLEKEFLDVSYLTTDQELPSKVVLVPKTMKGPRIIAAEPLAAQFVQQGIRSYLYDKIASSRSTGSRINFRDQSINQKLALMSSLDGTMATLDLSDASDRVLHDLAMCMFHGSPVLAGAVLACRTTTAKLPSGTLIGPLKKFASMGSALCFPIEAMYFYTICIVALIRKQGSPFDARSVHMAGRRVFVYGDDLVVPVDDTVTIIEHLQRYLCKVNTRKSFTTGRFRESCGTDAYMGESVTPTYVRRNIPNNRQQHTEIISLASTANAFYRKGYWYTARFLFERIESIIGTLPLIGPDSSAIGRITYLKWRSTQRWNRDLQRFEINAFTSEPVYYTDRLEGYAALGKSLSILERQGLIPDYERDPLHLERSARHGVAALKRRWVPVT